MEKLIMGSLNKKTDLLAEIKSKIQAKGLKEWLNKERGAKW